jgi:hypothetical protein
MRELFSSRDAVCVACQRCCNFPANGNFQRRDIDAARLTTLGKLTNCAGLRVIAVMAPHVIQRRRRAWGKNKTRENDAR